MEIFLEGCARVFGTISTFLVLRLMRIVNLANTKVAGDINGYENMGSVTYLSMMHCNQIRGDFLSFRSALSLIELDMTGVTEMYGKIDIFETLLHLRSVNLTNCRQLEGDIICFTHHQKLEFIELAFTRIEGDIIVFKGKRLRHLGIRDTKITGDYKSVDKFKFQLRYIDTRNVKLHGKGQILVSILHKVTSDIYAGKDKNEQKHVEQYLTRMLAQEGKVNENTIASLDNM